MLETVTEIYAFFLSLPHLQHEDKLAWSRSKGEAEKGITRPPMKNQYFCGVRALIEKCRAGIVELTGKDYWRCHATLGPEAH